MSAEIRTYSRAAFDRATRFQLHVEGDEHTLDVLAEAGVLDRDRRPLERPPGHVVARTCCRSAYLRGSFLGSGSLSGPRSPHLELRFPRHAGATFLRAVASTEDVPLRIHDRPSHSVAYAKSWDAVEGYLAAAGAVETALSLEERAVLAGVRAQANRLANADHANLVRQSEAARTQLDAVRRLAAEGVLDGLPVPLLEAAELRSRHPALSLRELAEQADPPVSKAAMQRRLQRLVDLAGE